MWSRFEPTGVYSNTWRIWRIEGELDLKVLEDAITEIALRHSPLHTTFEEVNGFVTQVLRPEMKPAFEVVDFTGPAESENAQAFWDYLNQFALHKFDLTNGPIVQINILRLGKGLHILMPCINHPATECDPWDRDLERAGFSLCPDFSALGLCGLCGTLLCAQGKPD